MRFNASTGNGILKLSPAMMATVVCGVLWVGSRASAEVPADAVSVEWQPATRRLIAARGLYARIARLASGELLCVYQRGSQCRVKRSADEGATWGDERVAARYAHGAAANPELLQLADGAVLLCFNERPRDGAHPFAIALARSRDAGRTWSAPRRLFSGGTRFENGCWEPAAVQLPNGQVRIYFANEAPYTASNEQEISMLRSLDGGTTWLGPDTVAFRSGHRDGMPVPCLLRDGRTLAIAIEDNGFGGPLKPAILYTDITAGDPAAAIGGDSPRRRFALARPLPKEVYAGAPYLCRLPSGPALLSVQSDDGRRQPRMVLYIGNEHARDFRNPTAPFDLPDDVAGQWNSLFVKNADTVVALSSTRIDGTNGVWAVDGRIH